MYGTNNYGYPYGTYMPQRPMPQPIQQQEAFNGVQSRSILNGKPVDSIESAKIIEYPLDGSVSYYPLTDNSAIVTKQLGMDGTSKIIVYKPIQESKKEEPKYVTMDNYEELKEQLDDLKGEIKELKKKKKDE